MISLARKLVIRLRGISNAHARGFEVVPKGIEEFLSVPCSKFLFTNENLKVKGEILTWNNIPMKIIVESANNVQHTEAFKVDSISIINNKVFLLPAGISVLDMTNKFND